MHRDLLRDALPTAGSLGQLRVRWAATWLALGGGLGRAGCWGRVDRRWRGGGGFSPTFIPHNVCKDIAG